jgi:hypothetical protein
MKPEAQLSCAVREAVDLYRLRERCICFKIHNDMMPTFKSRVPAAAYIKKLKDQGCVVGVPDWIFIWEPQIGLYKLSSHMVGFIELKIEKNKQSEGQKDFEQWCKRIGPCYRIAHRVDEVINIWKTWKLI